MVLLLLAAVLAQESWEVRDDGSAPPSVVAHEEVDALDLLAELEPSSSQARTLTELSDAASAERAAHRKLAATLEQDLQTSLEELKKELLSGCGHGAAIRERVSKAEALLEAERARYATALKALEGRLGSILDSVQLAAAARHRGSRTPGRKPPSKRDPQTDELVGHFERLRNLPDAVHDRILEPLLAAVMEDHEPWREMSSEDRGTESARIRRLFEFARRMGNLDFEARKTELAWEIVDGTAGGPAAVDPRLTPAGRTLLNPRASAIIKSRQTAVRKAETECPTCRERRAAPKKLSGPKPEFRELAAFLGLDPDQRAAALAAVGRGQAEFLDALSLKRDDGRIPLVELWRAGSRGEGEESAAELMRGGIPGTRETVWQRAVALKLRMEADLRRALTAEQYGRYQASGADLFGVQVGDLRRHAGR